MTPLTTNFTLEELVPQSVFKKFGASATWFLDMDHVRSMQWLRDNLTKDFGKQIQLIVNNWATGGSFQQRGFRTQDSASWKPYSQHTFGRAADFHSPELTITELYTWIMDHQSQVLDFTSIRAVEDITVTKTWLHCDSRWIQSPKGILVVKP